MAHATAQDASKVMRQFAAMRDLVAKLKSIHKLWLVVHNWPEPVEKFAAEFYFAVGDIFEGVRPEDLRLNLIDKASYLQELRDD